MLITASKLYDYLQCPHKVWRDIYGPQEEKIDEKNPFVELLWEKGALHEKEIISGIGSFIDLSEGTIEERINKTLAEIKKGTTLIYQGVIRYENLLGIPDLLRIMPTGNYLPIDIKSGKGFEGPDESEDEEIMPKKHYAVQLSLYVEILLNLSFASEKKGAIIDISGRELVYLLENAQGVRNTQTWWELYLEIKNRVSELVSNQVQDKPAIAGSCKLCPWYNSCKKWCLEKEDLTKIFYLGRSNREILNKDLGIEKVRELKTLNISDLLAKKKKDKTFLKGFGETLLKKFITRAIILDETKKPVLHQQVHLPEVKKELFFDIEDDPTQDFVYLHGIYSRDAKSEEYIYFLAKENTRDAEKKAWQEFWNYIDTLHVSDYSIYYYSHHEKTAYRRLSQRYPEIIAKEKLDTFFDNPNAIDLYRVVEKHTDWPLSSYSLKDLATYLGFKWRDESPSGALSIRWYNDFLQNHSEELLKRILEYNEDDCRATMVLKDGISKLNKE
ncbi:MAG: TM0106 family RecB-like putative nuclease [Candidatus Omnitrophica bacterium]|nr:TM0106 family RecB-like putative nuclease [Candidatus Omnitrophota bacterium]